jgi:hypothetical protein
MFKNRPIRNKNCLWRPCLLMDRDKMSNLYRGPSIYASYQVSVHMVEGFQRWRLKCRKLTDDGWRTTSDGKSSHCLPLARWAKKGLFFRAFNGNTSTINVYMTWITLDTQMKTPKLCGICALWIPIYAYSAQEKIKKNSTGIPWKQNWKLDMALK